MAPLLLLLASAAAAQEIPLTPPPPLVPTTEQLFGAASDGRGVFFLLGLPLNVTTTQQFYGWMLGGDAEPALLTGGKGAVAAGDSGYLAVAASTLGGNATAQRISTTGQVVDATPLVLGNTGTLPLHTLPPLAVAWDGSRWIVAAGDRISFVGGDGHVSDGGVYAAADAVSVAAHNGVAVVVWKSGGAVSARTIAGTTMNDPVPLGLIDSSFEPQVAAGDDGFLATWSVNGRLVALPLDAGGRPGALFDVPLAANRARIVGDGSAYAIVAQTATGLRGIRVTAAAPAGDAFDVAGDAQAVLALVASGGRTLVAYAAPGVYAKFLGDADAIPVHPHAAAQYAVGAAFDGVDVAVVFQQERASSNELRLARVTARGEPLDGAGIVVGEGVVLGSVAGGGGTILATWAELRRGQETVFAQRFTAAATPLDPAPIPLAANTAVASLRAVWDGSSFVVFYAQLASGTFAARIGDGSAPVKVHPAALSQLELARSRDRYMLAYWYQSAVAVTDDLHLATGSVSIGGTAEAIASDGNDFLPVFRGPDNAVIAQGVSWNADLLGPPIVVAPGPGNGRPRVRWDGAWWTVTWPKVVDDGTLAFVSERINRAGAPLDPICVARTPQDLWDTALTDWDEAASLLVYSRQRIFVQREQPARRRAAGR